MLARLYSFRFIIVVALLCLNEYSGESLYFLTMTGLSVAWAFGLPYFQAFEARLDPGGSVVVAGGLWGTDAGLFPLGFVLPEPLGKVGENAASWH